MSVADFAQWAGIGRTLAWQQIKDRELRAIKSGGRTLVTLADAMAWLASRPDARQQGRVASHEEQV